MKNIKNIKEIILEYISSNNSNNSNTIPIDITIEMVIDTLSKEFPELLLPIAEENYIRGYHEAMDNLNQVEEEMRKQKKEKKEKKKS